MVVVKIQGGLGNQMFQFAFYKFLESKGYNALVDLSFYDYHLSHYGFEIVRVFESTVYKLSTADMVNDLAEIKNDIISRFRRKFFPKKTHYIENIHSYNHNYRIIESLLNESNVYLDGYWEDQRYFSSISKTIRELYTFPDFVNPQNIALNDKIANSLSVSIHIRRGDKVHSKIHRIHLLDYYVEAINLIQKRLNYETVKFFVFSDDIDWTRENFNHLREDFEYVVWNKGKNSFRDMQLISLCKHNINASSTFSWWASYLNKNPDKIVITPKKVFKDAYHYLENTGLIPSDWIQI